MDGMKDLLLTILQKMETVETFSKLNGQEKKLRVMASLKCFMTDADVEQYKPIISGFIDVICDLARGSDSIHINNVKKCFPWKCIS